MNNLDANYLWATHKALTQLLAVQVDFLLFGMSHFSQNFHKFKPSLNLDFTKLAQLEIMNQP